MLPQLSDKERQKCKYEPQIQLDDNKIENRATVKIEARPITWIDFIMNIQ